VTRNLLETFSALSAEVISGDPLHRYTLGELTPQIALRPKTLDEISAIFRLADENQAAVVLWGGGTSIGLGNFPSSYDLAVDMTDLKHVISHDKDNFTITVQAGLRLGELQRILRAAGQFLPLNPPEADKATLGGLIAANISGPWRLAYGAVRDIMLGIKVVVADGRIVAFGGKTMKNVAGYDVGKLFIGSLGTLGAIGEVTLRLYALPEKNATVLLPANSLPGAFDLANQAITLSATGAEILDPLSAKQLKYFLGPAFDENSWLVAVDLMGDEEVVRGRIAALSSPSAILLEGNLRQLCWDTISQLTKPITSDALVGRASLPPAAVKRWLEQVIEMDCRRPFQFVICPGTGRAWIIFSANESSSGVLTSLRLAANRLEGYFTIEAAPESWKTTLPIWDEAGVDLALLKGVKQVFDPNNILAPGRFLGGI
jgi:glycolate oxidase FAD binding subunit